MLASVESKAQARREDAKAGSTGGESENYRFAQLCMAQGRSGNHAPIVAQQSGIDQNLSRVYHGQLLQWAGMGRIRSTALIALFLMSLSVTACTMPGVCSAIGWINTVDVQLRGNVGEVAAVEMCVDEVCASSVALEQSDEQLHILTPEELSSYSPTPTVIPTSLFSISQLDDENWRITLDLGAPETITLRALSVAGDVLVEESFPLEWQRVGGSEQCGGPEHAGPVALDIPA